MVVWLFASAGHSEIKALPQFLNKNFPRFNFQRKFPVSRKPAPKLRSDRIPDQRSQGASGRHLAKCITQVLKDSFSKGSEVCDLILVIDDLDCCDLEQRKEIFLESIDMAFKDLQDEYEYKLPTEQIVKISAIPKYIGFAVPEIESWIIADWSNTIAGNSSKFRTREVLMKRYLQNKNVQCDAPESFGEFDSEKQACKEKLSELLIESSHCKPTENSVYGFETYSKALDTPEMLLNIDIQTVSSKCPNFRNLCNYLNS